VGVSRAEVEAPPLAAGEEEEVYTSRGTVPAYGSSALRAPLTSDFAEIGGSAVECFFRALVESAATSPEKQLGSNC